MQVGKMADLTISVHFYCKHMSALHISIKFFGFHKPAQCLEG